MSLRSIIDNDDNVLALPGRRPQHLAVTHEAQAGSQLQGSKGPQVPSHFSDTSAKKLNQRDSAYIKTAVFDGKEATQMRGRGLLSVFLLITMAPERAGTAEKTVETFKAYADSDLCAHLMLGPISPERIECSRTTHKKGSEPVLVRLQDNQIFQVNKQKMLKEVVGELVEATGEANAKDGRIKLQSIKSVAMNSIAPGTPGSELLDVRLYRATGGASAKMVEKIRHELAMMPYISEFDYISFTTIGGTVILTGWTVRITNRSTAYNIVKRIEGVEQVVNNIEVLPLGSMDMQIRAGARARLQQFLSRYFWGSGSAIKIIVKNGDIILLGVVSTKADVDLANIQCNSVPGSFQVFNMLRVEPDAGGKKG